MSTPNKAYRRILIINKKTDKVVMDRCEIGPIEADKHLLEIFANTPCLKNIKAENLEVKHYEVHKYGSI